MPNNDPNKSGDNGTTKPSYSKKNAAIAVGATGIGAFLYPIISQVLSPSVAAPAASAIGGAGATIAGTGAAIAGAAALPAAAIYQAKPHYYDMQRNAQNPIYDTQSAVSSYTDNPYPGQQVGTGQNTGTKPEYEVGYRYPYLEHEVTTHDLGGPKDRTNIPGWSPNGDPYRAEDLDSKLSGFFGAPLRGLVNAGLNRYNATRDYMEGPTKSGTVETDIADLEEFNRAPAKVTGDQHNTQSGYVRHQDTSPGVKVNPADVTEEALATYTGAFGFNPDDKASVRNLQSFLVNSKYDIGSFGEGGVDGKYGKMTNGAASVLFHDLSSQDGVKNLVNQSPYLKDMYTEVFRGMPKGSTQFDLNDAFRKAVYKQIAGGNNTADGMLASGLRNDGRKGGTVDSEKATMGTDVVAVQQKEGTSNKDAFEKTSMEGRGSYKDKKEVERKTGKQDEKYKGQYDDQPNWDSMTFDKAFGTARKMGLKQFPYKGTEIAVKLKRFGGVFYNK